MVRDALQLGTTNKSYVLTLGDHGSERIAAIEAAAKMADQAVQSHLSLDELGDSLEEKANRPSAFLVNMDSPDVRKSALEVRSRFSLAAVPIIGVASEVNDLTFEEAFSSGMDDCCPIDDGLRLGRRLRHLAEFEPVSVERRDRTIVIADSDRETRLLMGRVFRDAGFEVSFALDQSDALRQSLDDKVVVVVCSDDIEQTDGEQASLSSRACAEGSAAAWIINTPPKQIPAALRRFSVNTDARVAVHDAFAAPATLLFVANELLSTHGKDGRSSERLLYGASVRFRPAGRDGEESGYLFNIGAGGVYVCTLAIPERWDELWLEFSPPRSDRRVHLEGTVVWTRRYGPGGTATVPTGFGVQISGASQTANERYARSYEAFLAERVALRETVHPQSSLPPGGSVF